MGYTTGIGISGALVQLPMGILQGEEIRRRREREDEASSMARAEFENRQAIFGRTKQDWARQDAVSQIEGDLQAGNITPEEAYTKLAKRGYGAEALRLRGVMTNLQQGEQNLSQGKQLFEQQSTINGLQIGELDRKRVNQNIIQGMLGLDTKGANPEFLDMMNKVGAERGLLASGSRVVGMRRTGKRNQEGIETVEYSVDDGSGNITPKQVDIETLGGALGVDDLRAVGTAQASRRLHRDQVWMQKQGLDDARMAQLITALHQMRKEAVDATLKDVPTIEKEMESIRKEMSNNMMTPGYNASKDELRLKQLEDKKDVAVKSAALLARGFEPVIYRDSSGEIQAAQVRTVVPVGAKPGDRQRAINYRFDDNAFWNNNGSTMVADMLVKDKNSPEYKMIVEKTAGKWAIPVVNPSNGKMDVITSGTDTPASSAPLLEKAKANGFVPMTMPGIDYGQAWGHWDLPGALELAEKFRVKHHSMGVGSGSKGYGVLPK